MEMLRTSEGHIERTDEADSILSKSLGITFHFTLA